MNTVSVLRGYAASHILGSMKPAQLVKHFGSQLAASKHLRCYQSTISHWVRAGHIPVHQQLAIEYLTRGKLKANLRDAIKDSSRTFRDIEQRLSRRA